MKNLRTSLIYAMYFAPRGRERLLAIGEQISQRHMSYSDRLVGIVGDAGSGKSLIIQGMFPGLVLSNDDDVIDPAKIMQVRSEYCLDLDDDFKSAAYHLDMRFQTAFTQMYEIVDFVRGALDRGRRVVVEHFDLLYPWLKRDADIMIGIGEEIIVTRPNIFGPLPKDIYDVVYRSLRNRKMAHTAEDLTTLILRDHLKIPYRVYNSDVRGGFVLSFYEEPGLDIAVLESKVKEFIDLNLSVSYHDEDHIRIGNALIVPCTGPRIHVRSTGDIKGFLLLPELKYDSKEKAYCLAGVVGDREHVEDDLNKISGDRL